MEPSRTTQADSDLPKCCHQNVLAVPRPWALTLDVSTQTGAGLYWDLGMERWKVRLIAHWPHSPVLKDAVSSHLGVRVRSARAAMSEHGIAVDREGAAQIGQIDVVTARLGNPLASPSGRRSASEATDLRSTAEFLPNDLARIVQALAASGNESLPFWSNGLMEQTPTALFADMLLMLSSMQISPLLRGQGLGAWLAAQAVATFATSETVVAAALPVVRPYEDESWLTEPPEKLFSKSRPRLRDLNDYRFARHWRDALGLRPLSEDPTVVTLYTWGKQERMQAAISRWSTPGLG